MPVWNDKMAGHQPASEKVCKFSVYLGVYCNAMDTSSAIKTCEYFNINYIKGLRIIEGHSNTCGIINPQVLNEPYNCWDISSFDITHLISKNYFFDNCLES